MNKSFFLLPAIGFFLIVGCSNSYKNLQAHNTAQIEHHRMQQATTALVTTLDALTQQRNSIEIQGRALTEQELNFSEQVRLLNTRFEEWQKKIREVPSKFQTSKEAAAFLKEQEKQSARLADIYRQAKELK